ncbi:Iron-sulfur assembly protein 1 [Podospora pseudopauciseta]|uniref:Iron-sulfur assembly protein 1 n=1 Tax=Podospora pseudopauciseta TaxID=2093780 RepID=A0ABR0HIJ0_9PEZI|nr:Iron-sulfur assembly protein 1 [Podospora pseudopauciseta]
MNASSLLARRAACLACRRSFFRSSNQQRQFSSTPAQLAAAFQSYSLPSHPPPAPRNATAPDTSITHNVQSPALPRVHETRPPKEPQAPLDPASSLPEREAQQSKSNTQLSAPSPRPRSKLRAPRKAAMKLTPAAVDHLRALLDQPDPKLIKVGVRNRGCSGLAYHLEFVEKPGAFDETVEQDGVKVLIDSKALFSIIGSEMDWIEDKLSQRFVFRNPNIKEQCGCGESFMV